MSNPQKPNLAPTFPRAPEFVPTPTRIPTHDFDPPPHIAAQILADFHGPMHPLSTIAEKAGTTVELLAIWLARPDIAARIDAVESTLRRRARFQVINFSGNIFEACATVVDRYTRSPDRGPHDINAPETHAIFARNAENALMASRVLLHMARYLDDSLPPRQRTPRLSPDTPPTVPNNPTPAPTLPTDHSPRLNSLPSLPDPTHFPELRPPRPTRTTTLMQSPRGHAGGTRVKRQHPHHRLQPTSPPTPKPVKRAHDGCQTRQRLAYARKLPKPMKWAAELPHTPTRAPNPPVPAPPSPALLIRPIRVHPRPNPPQPCSPSPAQPPEPATPPNPITDAEAPPPAP